MTEQPQSPPLTEAERLDAAIAKAEAERAARVQAGKWSRGALPKLVAVPRDGEVLEVAQQRALYAHLAQQPDAPKNISAYDWIDIEVVTPEPADRVAGRAIWTA